MKGDFTRDTFDRTKHFSRVLMQQGRVQLDADWNEQAAIMLHYLRALAADLIGPFGGTGGSFEVFIDPKSVPNGEPELDSLKGNDFFIRRGHYYVDGLLCENEGDARYADQFDLGSTGPLADSKFPYLVYLDVWERHITYFEEPTISEVALGGSDTATRAKIVWQVKALPLGEADVKKGKTPTKGEINSKWKEEWVGRVESPKRGLLTARVKAPEDADLSKPCLTASDTRYRGAENQLYRVEVHTGGPSAGATFKWSRENGSIVFPIVDHGEGFVTLAHLGRDEKLGLKVGDYVEIVADKSDLGAEVSPLVQVDAIDAMEFTVRFKVPQKSGMLPLDGTGPKSLLLRRWDHKGDFGKDGGVALTESGKDWYTLEDGIQIQFQEQAATYRRGDYWLIPARTRTGDIEWPRARGKPQPQPPHGIEHHYAPLAVVSIDNGKVKVLPKDDYRSLIEPIAS